MTTSSPTTLRGRAGRRRALATLVAMLLVMTACSDGGSDESTSAPAMDSSADFDFDDADDFDGDGFAPTAPAEADAPDAEPSGDGGDGTVPTDVTAIGIDRDIVYTAELDVRVADVAAATAAAIEAIDGIGLVFGQQTTSEPDPRTVLIIKVDPADFDDALAALGGIGQVARQSVSADDVTERVVDIQSRITTAEASVERLRALLEGASDLEIIAGLEQQLLERETTLEVLRGQLRTLQDQVALATITLTITKRSASLLDASLEITAWLGDEEDEACPGSSELEIGANDDAVLCIEVDNTGDDALTEIDIEVPTFNFRVDDLTVRSGSIESIAPGEALTAIVVLEAEDGFVRRRDVRNGTDVVVTVTAVPAGDVDARLEAQDRLFLTAPVDDALPGFGDSVGTGWDALTTLVGIVLVGLGVLVPFLPFLVLLAWLARRHYRKGLVADDDGPV